MSPTPAWMNEELELLASTCRQFFLKECVPHYDRWEQQGCVDREIWQKAGTAGLLCASMPELYGGAGGNFAHEAVIAIEANRAGVSGLGIPLHNAIVAPYILNYGSEEQKRRWLPGMATSERIGAIAMSEPAAGSDLQGIRTTATRKGNGYVLNGQKTFITNGHHADRVLVVAKTDPAAGAKGMSLFWVDARTPGFSRGQPLDKIGHRAQDTVELFFDAVMVPDSDMVGAEHQAFSYLMHELAQERLMIALRCAISLEAALEWTIAYTKERSTFGKPLIQNQYTRFKLAEIKTLAAATRAFVDQCAIDHMQGALTADRAAMAKLWASEATRAIDDLLQMFGGNGFMREYPIARMLTDIRGNRIYGGASEIMKEIISRTL